MARDSGPPRVRTDGEGSRVRAPEKTEAFATPPKHLPRSNLCVVVPGPVPGGEDKSMKTTGTYRHRCCIRYRVWRRDPDGVFRPLGRPFLTEKKAWESLPRTQDDPSGYRTYRIAREITQKTVEFAAEHFRGLFPEQCTDAGA